MTLPLEMTGPFKPTFKPIPAFPVTADSTTSKFDAINLIYRNVMTMDSILSKYQIINYAILAEKVNTIDTVLNPAEIATWLRVSQLYEQERFYREATGFLINRLITVSHNAGFSQFTLNFHGLKPILYVCMGIIKKEDCSLEVAILGEVERACAENSVGGTYYIEKAVRPGKGLKDAIIYCSDGGHDPCSNALNVTMYLNESVNCAYHSKNSRIYMHEVVPTPTDFALFSQGCSFYCTSYQSYRRLISKVKDGSAQEVRYIREEQWKDLWKPAEDIFTRGGFP